MPSFRERIANLLVGDIIERNNRQLADVMMEAYRVGPMVLPPEALAERLLELDPQYADMMLRHLVVYDSALGIDGGESQRVRLLKDARSMYESDVLSQHIIDLWTDFGFGLRVDVTPRDEQAAEVWAEFWDAARNHAVLNEREIQELSVSLLTDGEVFFVFFISKLDGTCTIRVVPSDQIKERVTDPDDEKIVLYWRREYVPKTGATPVNTYFADWRASADDLKRAALPKEAIRAEEINPQTAVVILPVLHRKRRGRGWPLLTVSAPYSRAYKNFLQDRAEIQRASAAFLDKVKVKGGQRTVDAVKARIESSLATGNSSRLETNPPPTAAATWLENDGMERSRLQMGTGAGDADTDGAAIFNQAVLGGRIFPHWAGRGEAFRLATATQMETPVLKAFTRYQLFWSSVWTDIAKIVFIFAELYGKRTFQSNEVDVNTDSLLAADPTVLLASLDTVAGLAANVMLDPEVANEVVDQLMRILLQGFGVRDVDEVMTPPELVPNTTEQRLPKAARLTESGETSYAAGIRSYIYGLWSGQYDQFQFVDGMYSLISRRLTQAWQEGALKVGVKPDELTDMERATLQEMINNELAYVQGLADFIDQNSKANGGRFATVERRADIWDNRYGDARNRAMSMAETDPKLKWVGIGVCSSCKRLIGKVKRASQWEAMDLRPGSPPNSMLECGGWQCHCSFEPTDEPMSRGPMPRLQVSEVEHDHVHELEG